MSKCNHFPVFFSNCILHLVAKPERSLELTLSVFTQSLCQLESSQETEALLGISEGIEYRALFAKVLLRWRGKKGSMNARRANVKGRSKSKKGSSFGGAFSASAGTIKKGTLPPAPPESPGAIDGSTCIQSEHKPETLLPSSCLLLSPQCLSLTEYNGSTAGRGNISCQLPVQHYKHIKLGAKLQENSPGSYKFYFPCLDLS